MRRLFYFFAVILIAVCSGVFAQETQLFSESFDSADWPAGWVVTDPHGSIWSINPSFTAGGSPNEMEARWQDGIYYTRAATPVIDVTGIAIVNITFKHRFTIYGGVGSGMNARLVYSTNGNDWYNSGWAISSDNFEGPETVQVDLNIPENADDLYLGWVTDGDHNSFCDWHIDDISVTGSYYYDVSLTQITPDRSALPGTSIYYELRTDNTGVNSDNYTFSLSKAWAEGVYADTEGTPLPDPFTIAGGGSELIYLKVYVPASAVPDEYSEDICQISGTGVSESVTVTTTAVSGINAFPWIETFESDSPSRAFWSQIHEYASDDWTWETGSNGVITTAYNGTLNARFVSIGAGSVYPITKLVTPVLDISGLSVPTLDFYYGQPDWSGDQNTLEVYYRKSELDPWISIWFSDADISTWTKVSLILPDKTNTYQIAFEGDADYGYANVLDDIKVYEHADYDVEIIQVTPNSTGNPGDTLYYQIQVENQGLLDDDYTFSLSKAWALGVYADTSDTPLPSPFAVTAGNTADVYLKVSIPGSAGYMETSEEIIQVNGTGVSDTVTISTTAFGTPVLPFYESFDGAGWPLGWSVIDPSGDIWFIKASVNAGGTANEMRAEYLSGTWTTRAETPAISVPGVSMVNISFKHYYNDYGAGFTAKVVYSTDGTNWTDSGWEIISGNGDVGPETASVLISLPARADELYVGWVTDGDHYQFDYWHIDDIAITETLSYDTTLLAEPSDIGIVLGGAGNYYAGETVNISAELPPRGYVFVEWTGNYANLLDNANMSAASFTMPEDNVTLTANYEEPGEYIPALVSLENEMLKGIWRWQYTQSRGSVWQKVLNEVTAEKIMAGDITNDGNLDLIVLFSDNTLYCYDISINYWEQLLDASAGLLDFSLAQTSIEGSVQLIVSNNAASTNIDAGINFLEAGAGYYNINETSADVLTGVDITYDGIDELIFAFTGTEGMYAYDFISDTITRIAISSPSQVISADVTGDGYDEAIAVVPGLGVYMIRYIPDKDLVLQMAGKSPFDLVKDIEETSVWISKNKGGKGLQFNRITWGTPDDETEISSGDIILGTGAEVFIVYQNRTYYYNYDSLSWSTLLYLPLKRIISGQFTGREKDDLIVCDAGSTDLYLYSSYTDSWEIILPAGNSNAMATIE